MLALAVCSTLFVTPRLWAQTGVTLEGTITDAQGAALPGVQVTVTGAQGSRTAVTDAVGFYRIQGLPAGVYRLTASLDGFAPREMEDLTLPLKGTPALNFTLELSAFREEVVVTAQKRAEPLANVPAAVSVVTGQLLEEQRAEQFQDLVPLVPGLSLTTSRPGATRVTLRGINTNGVASTVGVYQGDVPFGSSSGLANGAISAGDFDTFDMARVEVLRGPQGTLYGASSLGGVMKYVPNLPSSQRVEVRVLGTAETVDNGDPGYSMTGLVNLPVSGTVAVRASGFYRFDAGFLDSIGNNPIPSLTVPGVNVLAGTLREKGLNSLDRFGGRISGLFKPSDRFSVLLAAHLQNVDSDASSFIDADPTTLAPIDRRVQSRYQSEFNNTAYRVYSATVERDFGAIDLESISSYGTFKAKTQADLALARNLTGGTALSALVTALFGDARARPLSAILPQTTSTDKFTQEFRVVSPKTKYFDWLAGFYYTDEDSAIRQKITAVEAGTDTIATGVPGLADVRLDSTYKEWALFGNATVHITPRFDVTVGARQSGNDQVASQISDGVLAGGFVKFDDAKSSEKPFTYSVAPRVELKKNTSIYGRIATGFRPGGPNVLPPAAPPSVPRTYTADRLTNYEVGLKTSNDRAALDISAFYLDWTDIQLLLVVNNFGVNGNGGKAVSKGLEFAASVFPTRGLALSVNGAYTNASLEQDTDPVVAGLKGDPLPYVPKWSFGVNGDYEWPKSRVRPYAGGSLGYTGERTVQFNSRAADRSLRRLDGFETLNLHAGFYVGRWNVELFGRNLTNALGVTSLGADGVLPNGALGLGIIRPRTFGVSVGTRFWGS